ncbi:hypothetical protein AB6A40_001466 [Gnathostoma spinigerum]|uniref:Uncharacterized protein n=1 Tax=Gnathostoma spinigerum TaxID=75299 RepID=A0ABD6E6A9_9BILA
MKFSGALIDMIGDFASINRSPDIKGNSERNLKRLSVSSAGVAPLQPSARPRFDRRHSLNLAVGVSDEIPPFNSNYRRLQHQAFSYGYHSDVDNSQKSTNRRSSSPVISASQGTLHSKLLDIKGKKGLLSTMLEDEEEQDDEGDEKAAKMENEQNYMENSCIKQKNDEQSKDVNGKEIRSCDVIHEQDHSSTTIKTKKNSIRKVAKKLMMRKSTVDKDPSNSKQDSVNKGESPKNERPSMLAETTERRVSTELAKCLGNLPRSEFSEQKAEERNPPLVENPMRHDMTSSFRRKVFSLRKWKTLMSKDELSRHNDDDDDESSPENNTKTQRILHFPNILRRQKVQQSQLSEQCRRPKSVHTAEVTEVGTVSSTKLERSPQKVANDEQCHCEIPLTDTEKPSKFVHQGSIVLINDDAIVSIFDAKHQSTNKEVRYL